MGMYLVLVELSAKRLELLAEEPELMADVIEMRREGGVAGMIDVGKAWDALRHVIEPWDPKGVLGKLLGGDGARKLPVETAYGHARLYDPAALAQVAAIARGVPEDAVHQRFVALKGAKVHGRFFDDPDSEEGLDLIWRRVRTALVAASAKGCGLGVALV